MALNYAVFLLTLCGSLLGLLHPFRLTFPRKAFQHPAVKAGLAGAFGYCLGLLDQESFELNVCSVREEGLLVSLFGFTGLRVDMFYQRPLLEKVNDVRP